MSRAVLAQLSALVIFWILFLGLQNRFVYSNTLGLISDNIQNVDGKRTIVDKPYDRLTNENYIRWDGIHYKLLRDYGYDVKKAGSDYIFAFFPLFPIIWRLSVLPPVGVLFLNYFFLSISVLLLLRIFSDEKDYLKNALFTLVLPSIIIFFIPYSEATFLLMMSIGIYGFSRTNTGSISWDFCWVP